MCIYIYMYTRIYVYMYICIYVYTCIYMYSPPLDPAIVSRAPSPRSMSALHGQSPPHRPTHREYICVHMYICISLSLSPSLSLSLSPSLSLYIYIWIDICRLLIWAAHLWIQREFRQHPRHIQRQFCMVRPDRTD